MPRRFLSAWVLSAPLLCAQPAAFEAVSVKPAAQMGGFIEPIRESTPGRVTYRNYTVKKLLMEAYQLSRYEVEGPPWIERDRYDIIATKPGGTTAGQQREMLLRMLHERFRLTQHFEKKDLPAYVLLPGNTSRLHALKEGGDSPDCQRSGTMRHFAELLATILDKPVVDQTGISGRYYFILVWSPTPTVRPEGESAPPPPPPPASAIPGCVGWEGKWPPMEGSLFDAVREEMGLRLERRGNQTVNVMVLDRVEKATAN